MKIKNKKTTEKKLPLHGKILNEINQIIETLNKRNKKIKHVRTTTYIKNRRNRSSIKS